MSRVLAMSVASRVAGERKTLAEESELREPRCGTARMLDGEDAVPATERF